MNDSATFARHDTTYFQPILPLVRADSKIGLFGEHHRVAAIFEDAIVCGGCQYLETVHAGPLSAASLSSRLSGGHGVRFDDETRVTYSPGGRRTRRAKFVVHGKQRLTFFVPMQDTEHVLSFLQARLGDRLTIGKRVAVHNIVLLVFALLVLAAAVALPMVWEGGLPGGIALGILAALLASIFVYDHLPAAAPWTPKALAKQKQRDLSHRRPLRSPMVGWGMKIACAAVLLGLLYFAESAAAMVYLALAAVLPQDVAGILLLPVLWSLRIAALLGLYAGHLIAQRQAGYVQAQDKRPPILYLRSFLDDRKQTLVAPSRWAIVSGVRPQEYLPFPWRYVLMANPIRILRVLFGWSADTSEEQLGLFMRRLGPFVAIGQPGERFASPGAARMYVSNEEWKDVVDSYLDQSQFVVLQPASTEGVWWEVERVLTRVAPEKVLFCLVNFFRRPHDYEVFQLRSQQLLGSRLPIAGGLTSTPAFLFFRRDKTPCLVSTSYRSPLAWPLLGNPVDLHRTLQPFLMAPQADAPPSPAPLAPVPPSGIGFASHTAAAVSYFFIGIIASLVGDALLGPGGDASVEQVAQQPSSLENRSEFPATVPAAMATTTAAEPGVGDKNAPPPTSVDGMLAEIDSLISAGDAVAAHAKIAKLLAQQPDNPDAHGYLGMLLKAEGKLPEAAAEIQLALAAKPNDHNLWSILGQIQSGLAEYPAADASFSKAVELKPDRATFYFNRGFIRREMQRFDDAAADFAKSIELKQLEKPVLARACELCALSLRQAGKVVEALPYFNSAVELQPDNAEAQLNRALAFQSLGAQQFTDGSAAEFARKGFEEVLRLAPESNQAHFGRAIALQILGEHATAITEFDIVLKTEPKNDLVIWKRGYSHLSLGNYQQAAADYEQAAELDPNDRSAVQFLVRIYVAQGKFEEALVACRKLLKNEPANAALLQAQTVLLFLADAPAAEAFSARQQSTPAALQQQEAAPQITAALLTLLPAFDNDVTASALAAMQTLADGPAKNPLAGLTAAALQLNLGDIAAAKARLDAIDAGQLQGPQLAFFQLCEAELAAAADDPDGARKLLSQCTAWFDEFCPPQFAEGRPETFSADWASRSVLGAVYREASRRINAEQ